MLASQTPFREDIIASRSVSGKAQTGQHRADVASVAELNAKLGTLIAGWNDPCHAFFWSKTSAEIF
ncbi:hypothetical protein ACH9DO_14620 [Kocuria sp. M1N1S27]|uniref:hypothetical protein n=1 Tax=Kocuria kalidii TaxID=3376283 RepID=UPI0037A9B838